MKLLKYTVLPVFAATIWISISEFARNEFLVKSFWTNQYTQLGITYPADPVNSEV